MTNPFKQPEVLWKIEFPCRFYMLPLFEEYFAGITDTVSSYELSSETVESMPDDLWCFEAFFESEPDADYLRNELIDISESKWHYADKIKVSKVENIDWVAKVHEDFEPVHAGRFFITNLSHLEQCPQDMTPIIMESSRAFGTGEHNTTKGCIEAMEAISDIDIKSIMDIGTGTGILAIAAAKIWPLAEVVASDIEKVAIEVSAQHVELNSVNIKLEVADGMPTFKNQVDLIVSNILKGPLIELAGKFSEALPAHGIIILSGFLDYQVSEVLEAYKEKGFEQVNLLNKENWITLTLKRKLPSLI